MVHIYWKLQTRYINYIGRLDCCQITLYVFWLNKLDRSTITIFQENAREMELELREELDLVQAKVRDVERARDTAYEIIADHEATIQKFRRLVNQVIFQKV